MTKNSPISPLVDKIEFIKKTVEDYFGMKMCPSSNKIRKAELIQMRQISTYFSKIYTNASRSLIGKMIGNKTSSTVTWSMKTVRNNIDTDKYYRADIEALKIIIEDYKKPSRDEVKQAIITPSKQNAELRLYQRTQTFSRRARHYYNSK